LILSTSIPCGDCQNAQPWNPTIERWHKGLMDFTCQFDFGLNAEETGTFFAGETNKGRIVDD
jgi:hypothetical protein